MIDAIKESLCTMCFVWIMICYLSERESLAVPYKMITKATNEYVQQLSGWVSVNVGFGSNLHPHPPMQSNVYYMDNDHLAKGFEQSMYDCLYYYAEDDIGKYEIEIILLIIA